MEQISAACDALLEGSEGRLYVALSGGRDSTVLLHAMARSAAGKGCLARLTAIHVNHGLQVVGDGWRQHCEALARSLDVDFLAADLDLEAGANVEARARAGRYRVFESRLCPGDLLLLAHHADDQAESVLLHILQGRGLYGMPVERPLGAGRLVRPLLGLPGSSLAAYARTHALSWIEDPSNDDVSLDRNYLRHQILPPLNERFPGLAQRLERLAAHSAATTRALQEALQLSRNPLPLSVLDGFSRPVRLAVLRHWLVLKNAAAGVSDSALADFLDQLESANDRQPMLEAGSKHLRRYRRHLYLLGEPPRLEASYHMDCPGRLELPHGVFTLDGSPVAQPEQALDLYPPVRVTFLDALDGKVRIRAGNSSRKPRELMRLAGLPPWERARLPLLVDARGLALLPGVAARDPLPEDGSEARRCWWRWEVWGRPASGGEAR